MKRQQMSKWRWKNRENVYALNRKVPCVDIDRERE